VWTEPKAASERKAPRELTVAALRQAVEMWGAGNRQAYLVGEAAYERWIGWLRDVEAGRVADPAGGMQGNGWCYDVLIQNRRIAARWLKGIAGEYPAEAIEHLSAAAEAYARLVEVCMEEIGCPWDLTRGPGRFAEWTSKLRCEQIARLEAAREHDRVAIVAIGKALAAIGG
jgi:hypothetical protein